MNTMRDVITEEELNRLSKKGLVRFHLFCANQYKAQWANSPTYVLIVKTINLWLKGKIAKKKCKDLNDDIELKVNCDQFGRLSAILALDACFSHDPLGTWRSLNKRISKKRLKEQEDYFNELLSSRENIAKKKAIPVTYEEREKLSHKDVIRFYLFSVNQYKRLWKNSPESVKAAELVQLWLDDKITSDYCLSFAQRLVGEDVDNDVLDMLYSVTEPHYYPRMDLSYDNEKMRVAQRRYYNELVYIDDIFEKLVLEGKP
jgi:hypothetical protein